MFFVASIYVADGPQRRFLQLRWHPDKNPDKLEARIPLSLIACLLSQARVEPTSAMSCHVIFHSVFLNEIKLWAFSVAMCRLPTASSSSSKRQSHGFCTTQMLRQLGCRFVVFAYVSFPFHIYPAYDITISYTCFPDCDAEGFALSQSAVWPVGQLRKTCPLAAWAGQEVFHKQGNRMAFYCLLMRPVKVAASLSLLTAIFLHFSSLRC